MSPLRHTAAETVAAARAVYLCAARRAGRVEADPRSSLDDIVSSWLDEQEALQRLDAAKAEWRRARRAVAS